MCRPGDSWIGLYKYSSSSSDPSPSAQYWLDGSTSTFRRWMTGEPNENTFCFRMKMTTGLFADYSCATNSRFVCKIFGGQCQQFDIDIHNYFSISLLPVSYNGCRPICHSCTNIIIYLCYKIMSTGKPVKGRKLLQLRHIQ